MRSFPCIDGLKPGARRATYSLMAISFSATPDAVPGSWVERAPKPMQSYLRLMRADRPIGTWLLLIPCWQGLALAAASGAGKPILFYYAALFAVGAYVMRGAGCVYNDIVDRDLDAKVERTAARPLPSGQLSLMQAWGLLVALSLIGLMVLLQFNTFAVLVGLASLALVAAYPFMKRITYWPQGWLGLTFNWGALVGFAAAAGTLNASAFLLYAAGLFWTLGYDTIYAHQDVEDDALIGVKSAALRLGEKTKPFLIGFYGASLALFALAGALGRFSPVYFIALLPGALHFAWQIRRLDIHDSARCLMIFKSNRDAGVLLLLALLTETFAGLI